MKLIITGGFGYIGSNIAKHLISKGHEVIILDYLDKPINDSGPDCASQKCDITILEELEYIKVKNVDAVLHLAAQSSGPNSIKIPEKDIQVNILGTLNIIKWCQINNINKILFASSFVVYGNQEKEILKEDDHCIPKSVYATSKLSAEYMLKNYAQEKKINWNVLRMFNVYGPGQDITKPDQGLVGIFMNMLKKSNIVEVKGSLDRFRDIINIADVVQAWDLCLENNCDNEIFNLGTGSKTTFKQLILTLAKVMEREKDLKILEKGRTVGDLKGCVASLEKIKSKLNYRPKISLENGLKEMWEINKKI